jgi:hypothetical protein
MNNSSLRVLTLRRRIFFVLKHKKCPKLNGFGVKCCDFWLKDGIDGNGKAGFMEAGEAVQSFASLFICSWSRQALLCQTRLNLQDRTPSMFKARNH